ncbi:MAG TPA: hypothetical protein VHZ56_02160 [Devosia sp.]|nr:hypothetical protein [Devosia sp.]
MRFALASIALLVPLAAAAPASAAELSGMGADLFGNYFHFGQPNLQKPPVRGMTAGGVRIDLQHTKLSTLRAAFGGTIQTEGSEGSLASWLCYHTNGSKTEPAANTWFISNILGGGEFVMIVAVEADDSTPDDCGPAPARFSLPKMGIPGLGESSSALRNALGFSGGSKITYRADVPAADGLGTADNAQYLAYVLSGGVIAAYGVGETSVNSPKN